MVVAFLGQTFGDEFLSKDARLGQTVDAFADFEVDPIIANMVEKIVLVNEILRNVRKFDFDELRPVQRCAEVCRGRS